MLLRRGKAFQELDALVDKICVTASDRLRGWEESNRGKRYFLYITIEREVKNHFANTTDTKVDAELRLVVDVDLESLDKIEAFVPHDLSLPLSRAHKRKIREAFLLGCVRLATEPLDLELAADHAIAEIEEWIEDD